MHIIINKQLVEVQKIKEIKHWLWGRQWLVKYIQSNIGDSGEVKNKTNMVKWVKPSQTITFVDEHR